MIALSILALWGTSAEATPISGSFSVSGNFLPVFGSTGAITTLDVATGLDFIDLTGSASTPGVDGQFLVNSASGNFSSFVGQKGSLRDFTFAGAGSVNFPGVPLTAFESVGGMTFDLLTTAVVMQNTSFLVLSGTGVFNLAGFDPTAGTFSFSANGSGGTFSFSASNGANPVPEPATLVVLGSGLLVGAGGLRRWWHDPRVTARATRAM